MDNEKRLMELEYNLICDFIKLRSELNLTQKEIIETTEPKVLVSSAAASGKTEVLTSTAYSTSIKTGRASLS